MKLNVSVGDGSHLPALIKIINMTNGPVLELGMGLFSTNYLHWACKDRGLISYENSRRCFEWAEKFRTTWHEVNLIDDWDAINISGPWSVVLVDHSPGDRRIKEIKKLVNADYLVIHDSQPEKDRRYRYSEIYPLFKYRKDFEGKPMTTVLSNLYEIT